MNDRSMWDGGNYERLMGRWSRIIAPQLVKFADIEDGQHVLEVGCGTGSLTGALLDAGPGLRVTGIDGTAEYIAINRERHPSARVTLEQCDAQALPYRDNTFDCAVSLLVMNFIPDSARALREMIRVTRPGGTIAAAVWDYGDGMEMLRHLWDEAAAIDDAAVARHEGNMPLCKPGQLTSLWRESGLEAIVETGLAIDMEFASFDDYWQPFMTGVGPSGSYVRGLDAAMQVRLRDRLREKLTDGKDDAPLRLSARAWAVRGTVES